MVLNGDAALPEVNAPERNVIDVPDPPSLPPTSMNFDAPDKSKSKSVPRTTVNLTNLLKVEAKKETGAVTEETKIGEATSFTPEQLHLIWSDFAGLRKKFQAEYQLLSQPYEVRDNEVIVHLLNPVQETLLDNIKNELTAYLRGKLKNNTILVTGALKETDDKKMMYTSRDKFEFLLEKNPVLKELKERLGLDADF